MKTSPIRLNSKSNSKIRASRSPSTHDRQSVTENNDSRLQSSLHTHGVTLGPQRKMQSNLPTAQSSSTRTQAPLSNLILRSGSPSHKASLNNSSNSRDFHATKSFHQVFVSPQK